MKKQEILKELWEHIEIENFANNYWKQYKKEAKNRFFKNGLKKNKKELITIYNLQNYGYYRELKQKLYFDICN